MQTNFKIIKTYITGYSECSVGYASSVEMQGIEKKDNDSYWIKGYIDRYYKPTGKVPPEKENQNVAIFYPESKIVLWKFKGIEYKRSSEGYIAEAVNFQHDPAQWQAREEHFCPKYPELTKHKEGGYMAIVMHLKTLARCAIYATNLEDLNKLIAYFVHTHRDTDNLYIAGYENGKLLYSDGIVIQREKPAEAVVKPLNTHDWRDVVSILKEAGNKQFKGIVAYLSREGRHVFQTVTNSYVMAEVSISGEVTPIQSFKSKKALNQYFNL